MSAKGGGQSLPQQVAGLTEVCGGGGKAACLSLVEAELARLLGAPTEAVILLADGGKQVREVTRFRSCGRAQQVFHAAIVSFPSRAIH